MKKFTLLTTSVLLVGISSIALIISMSQLKGSIQDDISDNTVMEAMENITTENETKKEGGQEYKLDLPKDKSVVLYKEENVDIKGEYVRTISTPNSIAARTPQCFGLSCPIRYSVPCP